MLSDDELIGELRRLPELKPRGDGWTRLRQRAAREGLLGRTERPDGSAHYGRLALAATVLLAVALGMVVDWRGTSAPAETVPQFAANGAAVPARALQTVVRRSQLLDEALRYSPPLPDVVPVAFVSRATAIEDRIAAIDRRLFVGGTDLAAEEQMALWSERVEMMTTLVEMTYASAPERSL